MKRRTDNQTSKGTSNQTSSLAGRLKDLEHFTGVPETMPISETRATRVPVPRRSRVFLRGGDGHGAFADLTLTAPHPRLVVD